MKCASIFLGLVPFVTLALCHPIVISSGAGVVQKSVTTPAGTQGVTAVAVQPPQVQSGNAGDLTRSLRDWNDDDDDDELDDDDDDDLFHHFSHHRHRHSEDDNEDDDDYHTMMKMMKRDVVEAPHHDIDLHSKDLHHEDLPSKVKDIDEDEIEDENDDEDVHSPSLIRRHYDEHHHHHYYDDDDIYDDDYDHPQPQRHHRSHHEDHHSVDDTQDDYNNDEEDHAMMKRSPSPLPCGRWSTNNVREPVRRSRANAPNEPSLDRTVDELQKIAMKAPTDTITFNRSRVNNELQNDPTGAAMTRIRKAFAPTVRRPAEIEEASTSTPNPHGIGSSPTGNETPLHGFGSSMTGMGSPMVGFGSASPRQ